MSVLKIRCKHCREKGVPRNNSSIGFYCDKPECQDAKIAKALEKGRAALKKQVKETNKEQRAWRKEAIDKLKTLSEYEKEAKVFFQHWIRLRDAAQNCISCGTAQTELWDGGHFKKAELYSGTIFNENNCHKQCRKCNRFLGGNELNYREGLINRYGIDYVLEIEKTANELRQYKYTKQELIEIRNKYQKLVAELKKK